MLLETKNIRKNDIIIFSRNSMDENYNWRIVFKDDPQLYHRKISFEHIKKLITEYFPKNLIAYRILTNFPDVTIPGVKYGCIILLDGEPELIFSDPVYAVKTIEEYLEYHPGDQFRFRIQKVGYTTENKIGEEANYKEEFFFDLNVKDAINQNDEIFIKPLLKKQEPIKKSSNSIEEIKRNVIFIPENMNKITDKESMNESVVIKKKTKTETFDKRDKRYTDDELKYGGKKLKLGPAERKQDKKESEELLFPIERSTKEPKRHIEDTLRDDQQKWRDRDRPEKTLFNDEIKKNLRLHWKEDERYEQKEFKKIHGTAPIQIRKVSIDEFGSEKSAEPEPPEKQGEDLFTKFLSDLRNESVSKPKKKRKKKRKGKDSDILMLFKSVKREKSDSEIDQNKNIVLKADNDKKYE